MRPRTQHIGMGSILIPVMDVCVDQFRKVIFVDFLRLVSLKLEFVIFFFQVELLFVL